MMEGDTLGENIVERAKLRAENISLEEESQKNKVRINCKVEIFNGRNIMKQSFIEVQIPATKEVVEDRTDLNLSKTELLKVENLIRDYEFENNEQTNQMLSLTQALLTRFPTEEDIVNGSV